ncbi:squalene synthase HpnC [Formicincola oecophyllae]|uniref:Squalene synthase HpnC n=1 Tax=Formicincola oecophyllae TaxID=2558361 RepID=A0A4Y6UCW3_9PROT|nr:squalene synthase HpnC [Formicincola oecophyllae]QDH13955.1 squalene synthase HpnC [Formicincola oecophyllae]
MTTPHLPESLPELEALAWNGPDVTSTKGAGDENFPVGSILLGASERPAVHSYYRFARMADDVSDTTRLPPQERIARLRVLGAVLRGQARAPNRTDAQCAAAVRTMLAQRHVPVEDAADLLVAFEMDVTKNRYQSWEELLHYCRYSANPVGRFLLNLHGEGEDILGPSDALCTALQVINHLQDAGRDLARLDRCYLPQQWFEAEGVKVADLALTHAKPGVRRVFDRALAYVDGLNAQAARLPGLIRNRRMRLEAAVVVALCHKLTRRLHDNDPLWKRVALTKADFARATVQAFRHW